MSDWKHDEDQQNEIVFHVFPEHWPQKWFQQFAAKQSLFAVWHDRKENQKSILILITAAHVKKELNHSIGDKSSCVGPCSRFHDCWFSKKVSHFLIWNQLPSDCFNSLMADKSKLIEKQQAGLGATLVAVAIDACCCSDAKIRVKLHVAPSPFSTSRRTVSVLQCGVLFFQLFE